MKKLLMSVIYILVKTINTFIPKSNNKILFISRPDFADNAYYMYRYMKNTNTNINKQLSWIIYDKTIYQLLCEKGYENIYYLKSLSGAWEYIRSKYIITSSSSLWQLKSPLQKQYDLWHGIPLKNILCMGEKGILPKRQAGNITKRFATSSLSKALLAASFDYNAMKIEVTGQPRTDALFDPRGSVENLFDINLNDYEKVVIYMPTYRQGYHAKKEGSKFNDENIFRMHGYDHQCFLDYLKAERILFLLKLHPYEEKLYQDVELGNNIFWITNENMVKHDMSIYDILAGVDILITDYSSVYFDFLLLDKSIVFMPLDLNMYEDNRGFEIEPYEFWTPGIKVFNQDALHKVLLSSDAQKEQRKIVRDIMFDHQDGNASKRVYEELLKMWK